MMPSSTFRAWVLGTILAALISGVNQFFFFRYPTIGISGARLHWPLSFFFRADPTRSNRSSPCFFLTLSAKHGLAICLMFLSSACPSTLGHLRLRSTSSSRSWPPSVMDLHTLCVPNSAIYCNAICCVSYTTFRPTSLLSNRHPSSVCTFDLQMNSTSMY